MDCTILPAKFKESCSSQKANQLDQLSNNEAISAWNITLCEKISKDELKQQCKLSVLKKKWITWNSLCSAVYWTDLNKYNNCLAYETWNFSLCSKITNVGKIYCAIWGLKYSKKEFKTLKDVITQVNFLCDKNSIKSFFNNDYDCKFNALNEMNNLNLIKDKTILKQYCNTVDSKIVKDCYLILLHEFLPNETTIRTDIPIDEFNKIKNGNINSLNWNNNK